MNNRNIQNTLASLMSAAALTIGGCSSSSDPAPTSGNGDPQTNLNIIASGPVTQMGFFEIYTSTNFDLRVDVEADFTRYDRDISAYLVREFEATGDSCLVDTGEEEIDTELVEIVNNSIDVSAGDTLVVSSPAGTYITLLPESIGEYQPDAERTAPPPGLTLDIPGGEFPAFSNVTIPDVSNAENFAVSATPFTDAVEFSWTASTDPNTRITIGISTASFPNEPIYIDCDVNDDGSFTLPQEVLTQVGSFTEGSLYNATRYASNIARTGNTVVYATNTVAISF